VETRFDHKSFEADRRSTECVIETVTIPVEPV